jgi:hypothetical protein
MNLAAGAIGLLGIQVCRQLLGKGPAARADILIKP